MRAAGPLPDVPCYVITAKQADWPPEWPADQLAQIRYELQADLARLTPHTTHLIAEESGHFVQHDQPELVIDAIHRVVEDARASSPAPSPATRAGSSMIVVIVVAGALGLRGTALAVRWRIIRFRLS